MESARGAATLAKHRKSEKVGVKDVAFLLGECFLEQLAAGLLLFLLPLSSPLIPEKMYGISVPGFAATVPDRIHTGPEKTDNKLEAGLEALAQSKEGKEAKEGKRKAVAPRAARLLKPREED